LFIKRKQTLAATAHCREAKSASRRARYLTTALPAKAYRLCK